MQSLTGTHVGLPSRSRVPEPIAQAAAGRIASHPQPFAATTNPGAHAVTPTGAQAAAPIAARVPAAHEAGGRIGVQPAPPSIGVKPSPQTESGATVPAAATGGAASFDELPHAAGPASAMAAPSTENSPGAPLFSHAQECDRITRRVKRSGSARHGEAHARGASVYCAVELTRARRRARIRHRTKRPANRGMRSRR